MPKNPILCSFCGKSQHEVRKLIAGPTSYICDDCIDLCVLIINDERKALGEVPIVNETELQPLMTLLAKAEEIEHRLHQHYLAYQDTGGTLREICDEIKIKIRSIVESHRKLSVIQTGDKISQFEKPQS